MKTFRRVMTIKSQTQATSVDIQSRFGSDDMLLNDETLDILYIIYGYALLSH